MIQDLCTSCGAALCLIRHLQLDAHLAVLCNMENMQWAQELSAQPLMCLLVFSLASLTVYIVYNTNSNHLLYLQYIQMIKKKYQNACHSIELCQQMQRMLCYGLRIPISCCMLLHVIFNSSVGRQYSLKCCFPSCGLANKGAEIFLAMAVTVVRQTV